MDLLRNPAAQALLFGLLSAVSLPLGALTARFWKPGKRVTAAFMAFGAGALLSALTLDLVAKAVEEKESIALAIGCVFGSLVFVGFNQIINSQGGFLRKYGTTITFLRRRKAREYKALFQKMSKIPLFQNLPPEEIQALVPFIAMRTFPKGSTIIHQGDPGDSLFVVESGAINIIDERDNDRIIATLKSEDVFGEMALVTGEARSASARAESDSRVLLILKQHFDRLLQTSPKLASAVKELVANRISDLQNKSVIDLDKGNDWYNRASRYIDNYLETPTATDIKEASAEHGGAPFAIWLGMLLDGIPESVVLGASMIGGASVSFSLMAGLILSNFPEALSSSVGMRERNTAFSKIFWMWASLMLICGISSMSGNVFLQGASPMFSTLVEGMAAGAMLTMIAETMLPEAYHQGGSITGISTLLGFLSAVLSKMLE